MWTFQEMVLNGNPWIRCGSQRLLWRNLAHAIAFIYGNTPVSNKTISQWALLMWTWKSVHSRDSTETSTDRINEPSVPSNTQIYQDRDCERLSSWPGLFSPCLSFLYIVAIHLGLFSEVGTIVFDSLTRDPPTQIPVGMLRLLYMCLLYWIFFFLVEYICQSSFPNFGWGANIEMQDPINAVIQQLQRRNCTEARDKYYGVQAILGRLGIQPAPREQLQQLHTIYKYLFLSLLRKTETLNLLLCTSSPGFSQAPSWIPDWSRTDEYSWFNDRYLGLPRTDSITWHVQPIPILFFKYPACSGGFNRRW